MADFDADLARALEASAAEARAQANRPLTLVKSGANSEEAKPRTTFTPPLRHHFDSREGLVANGLIVQAGVCLPDNHHYPAWSGVEACPILLT